MNNRPNSKPRKAWVDDLRAVAMLLVIVHHLLQNNATFDMLTGPVMLPLFFAITGYLFNTRRDRVPDFFSNLFRRLILPWLLASVGEALILAPFRGTTWMIKALRDVAVGRTGWFLPCCAIAETLWFFIHRRFKGVSGVCAAALLGACAGYVAMYAKVLDLLMINRAMSAQAFLLIGWLFRTHEERLGRLDWPPILALLAAYTGLALLSLRLWPDGNLDIHRNVYYNLPYCLMLIALGCTALLLAARKLNRAPRPLIFIGQNTLIYYMTHAYGIRLTHAALSKLGHDPRGVFGVVVYTAFTCVFCAVIAVLVNRFLPELAGLPRNPKS